MSSREDVHLDQRTPGETKRKCMCLRAASVKQKADLTSCCPSPSYATFPRVHEIDKSRWDKATPLLQSHPAFRDKENTGDQFCSVTFAGGLQSEEVGEEKRREETLGRGRGEVPSGHSGSVTIFITPGDSDR
ncbi:unnamed protein product [Pleuronectes platessa]|uniref:Uncharacterized protein n=1 Tax=Pleuronectes platessa TaxID=8262 RepID=A0A9N7YY18_PLEPL|nr:unnamed protein product [Pleuronectes platessa]